MRYIIDITQLVHWPGNLTGIPRTMDELSIRFLQDQNRDTIFISWVKELGAMCEVDFAKTRPQRGNGIVYVKNSNHQEPESAIQTHHVTESKSANIALKHIAKKATKKTLSKTRIDQTPVFKKVLSTKRSAELKTYRIYTPKSGDKLFIPWGEWWDQNWLNLMKSYAKNSTHLYPICHDILPMITPQFSGNSGSLADFVTQVFPVSRCVLANSESTKNDLSNWMKDNGLTIPEIRVFRLGENFTFKESGQNNDIAKKYDIENENYIIYVSTIEPRKNHTLLYYTYKLAVSRNISLPKLLIVGRVGHDSDTLIHNLKTDPEINQLIQVCNNVDDVELDWLYQHCLFSVAPSFYEGWGMPVLESIARGKPVVCARTSSLLEMPKDCVTYFNPASTDECLSAIMKMLEPETLARYKSATKKYKPHTWDDSYKQVLKIMEEK